MNIPFYLEFLCWRMSCGGDGILEKICILFWDLLKWWFSYMSFQFFTSLFIYHYVGLLITVVTLSSTCLCCQICQRFWIWWTRPLFCYIRTFWWVYFHHCLIKLYHFKSISRVCLMKKSIIPLVLKPDRTKFGHGSVWEMGCLFQQDRTLCSQMTCLLYLLQKEI